MARIAYVNGRYLAHSEATVGVAPTTEANSTTGSSGFHPIHAPSAASSLKSP